MAIAVGEDAVSGGRLHWGTEIDTVHCRDKRVRLVGRSLLLR